MEYIDSYVVEILDVRNESINIYILLKCFFKLITHLSNHRGYVDEYIDCVNPSIAVTFIDNSIEFWRLKNNHPDLVTVFIQNGWRGETADVFGLLKGKRTIGDVYQVDYMLTFSRAVGKKYLEYISGDVIPIGSIKNNLYERGDRLHKGVVLFISMYKPPPLLNNLSFIEECGKIFFWDDFYAAERLVLPFLKRYCRSNKLELFVCARIHEQDNEERDYYETLLGDGNWRFLPKLNANSSYEYLNQADFIVSTGSTLGYESFARGMRTAIFAIRGKMLPGLDDESDFGWPADFPDSGSFWTNYPDEREFERVMNYITTVSDKDWNETRQRYVSDVMEYDPGNVRFIKLMRELGVPLKEKYKHVSLVNS